MSIKRIAPLAIADPLRAAPRARPAEERDMMAVVRAEIWSAARLTFGLGLLLSIGAFALVLAKLAMWHLVLPTGDGWTLAGMAVLLGIVMALYVGLDQLRELGLMAIGHRVARRLAAPLVLAVARENGRADIAAGQALRDVEELRRGLSGPLLTGMVDAVLVPALILLLLIFHWAFAAWALLCCAVAAGLSLASERAVRRALLTSNESHARTAGLVADAMRCAEAVEAMGLRATLARRWEARMRTSGEALGGAQATSRWIGASLAVVTGIASGGALVVGAVLGTSGVTIGFSMIVAMMITGLVLAPFSRLGGSLQDWAAALGAWRRLSTLLRPERLAETSTAFPVRDARLVMEHLTWAHRGAARPLLRDVSMVVAPGEVVALAGAAGAGKTTLLRIAVGMLRPAAGGCFLDGHATHQWEREDFARHVGYLPQDPLLTDGTLAEAIARLGTPDMAAVLRAARLADAHTLIAALPAGYATKIRAEGPLSAGQRQRVALARALYGGPRLLVLDEPAAWLDAEGEQRLIRLLRGLAAQGTAILLTSHRDALLHAADRMLVLRAGQIVPAPPRPAIAGPARGRGEAA
jgi:ATP-binding cassette subfamily C protein